MKKVFFYAVLLVMAACAKKETIVGPTGAARAAGTQIYSGTGTPATTEGSVGDY